MTFLASSTVCSAKVHVASNVGIPTEEFSIELLSSELLSSELSQETIKTNINK